MGGKKPVVMGRASRGLYHGKHIRFGNSRSHSERRHRRMWKPNVHRKVYRSHVLDADVSVRVTTHAMRCIDRAGGLDNYVLLTKKQKLTDGLAVELREEMEEAVRGDDKWMAVYGDAISGAIKMRDTATAATATAAAAAAAAAAAEQ
eukprot:TRINITY_DN55826_c0_g1_i1.p2 TRINITY_DN55826_c0_g1~~TRINITY_DN55826_c0_g1_i1.p2  ORF type:complete len:169 (+),score=67.04 TRINITY_DN55826_c0_g1_i1:69-509(+)